MTALRSSSYAQSRATTLRLCALGLATLGLLIGGAVQAKQPQSDEEKTLYFLGTLASQNIRELELSAEEATWVVQGLEDALNGREESFDQSVYGPKLREFATTRREKAIEKERAASAAFLEKAAEAKGAKKTESGLIYMELEAGSGAKPAATDKVKVHYHGTLRDGSVFDSSVQRGQPAEFPLNRVIACWTEGVARMSVGGKAKLICPPDIAYGDRGAPPTIPGGAVLTFEVELLEIVAADAGTQPLD